MNNTPVNAPLPVRLDVCIVAPEQLRAARGMLDWTRTELAKNTGLSAETIKNIEHGIYAPKEETVKAIIKVFSQFGIQFVCYETTIRASAEEEALGHELTISYSGIVCVTASSIEVQEASQQ